MNDYSSDENFEDKIIVAEQPQTPDTTILITENNLWSHR